MKVLVISRNPWDDSNSIGNTLSNFFSGVEHLEIANIYFRSSRPRNRVCKLYYRVTEKDILKNWFSPGKMGKTFQTKDEDISHSPNPSEQKEKSLISFIHKKKFKMAYRLSEFLWNSKKWINGNLNQFITAFAPDVVFTFVKAAPQYYYTIRHLRESHHIPIFSWIADDEYTGYQLKGNKQNIQRLQYILKESAMVCGCSTQICDYYQSVFGCTPFPLYKGCDLSNPLKEIKNDQLRIVYAGNLLYGRYDVIRKIGEALEKYDGGRNILTFEIYSNTPLSQSELAVLSTVKCVKYMGKHPYEQIVKSMSHGDVVLHAESFEEEEILKTKYSFSTKIIDCLQSGSVLLAVGPGELASVDYVKNIPGAFVIDDPSKIYEGICALLDDRQSYGERRKQIREFAILNHNSTKNSKKIYDLLETIVRGEA